MRTKKQLIIEYFFPVSYGLKRIENLSFQHATQTQPVGSIAVDHIKTWFP